MLISESLIITLLIGIVPTACASTVNLLQSCSHQFEVDVIEVLHLSINGMDWENDALSCDVIVKAEGSSDHLNFEVIRVAYRNRAGDGMVVEGSQYGSRYSVIARNVSVGFVQRASYRYIRVTMSRSSVASQGDYNIMMTFQVDDTDDLMQPAQSISVGAIVGIMMAVICVFAFAVIGIFCHCYRRNKQSKGNALTRIIIPSDTQPHSNRGHLTGSVSYTAPSQALSAYHSQTMEPLQVRLPPDIPPPPYRRSRMEPLHVQLPIDEGPPPYPGLPDMPEDIKPPMS